MKVFALSPCFLSIAGDGVHERKIAQEIGIKNQLFVVTFNIMLSQSRMFKGKIIDNEDHNRLIKLPIIRPVIIFSLFYGMMLSAVFSFYKIMGRKPFDILYIRDIPVAICLVLFQKWHKMAVVTKIVHFSADEYFQSPMKATSRLMSWIIVTMEKLATVKADAVLVPSELFKTEIINRYNISKNRVVSLSSGVDVRAFSSAINSRIPGSPFTLGYFGSLGCLHDIDCLLEALQLSQSKAHIKLILSTQDNPEDVLMKIEKYHLTDLVEIRRTRFSMMPRLMNEVEAVVIPRRKLSSTDLVLPLKLMEAGAAKKPVIIARTKIVEQELRNGQNALMYQPGDPHDLAEKITLLFEDEKLRSLLGENLSDFANNHEWGVILTKLEEVLLCLTASHKVRSNRNS